VIFAGPNQGLVEKRENSVGEATDTGQGTGRRSRTLTWQDPFITARQAGVTSGIEFLQKIVSGALPSPPIAEVLGFRLAKVAEGSAEFEFDPAEFHYNPIGVVHGGLAGMLLDSAMGCAVQSTLAAGMAYTTLEYKVNLVRAVTMKTGRMRAVGKLIYAGSRVGTAEGKLIDAEDKVYAHGTTTCLIFPLPTERR
jgi:uncharacterized protein (TIGR00369 family)